MLCEKSDSQTYIEDFKKRFVNFVEKAPVLLSIATTPEKVQVIDETTSIVHEFSWDFTIPVKSFIHGIKQILVEKCYPIIHKVEHVEVPLTDEEQVEMASTGMLLDEIPTSVWKKKITRYLLDKTVVYKDIFIIKDLETGRMYRYKMNKSSVFFLKDLRNKKFNQESAADYFFQNSVLLNELTVKDE